jgi:hypothetical protein
MPRVRHTEIGLAVAGTLPEVSASGEFVRQKLPTDSARCRRQAFALEACGETAAAAATAGPLLPSTDADVNSAMCALLASADPLILPHLPRSARWPRQNLPTQ